MSQKSSNDSSGQSDLIRKARLGLFVHWGPYSVSGWHEQLQWRRNVPRAEYRKLAEHFNPQAFDPDEWLDLAEEAGMRYVVFTTKHHDGFCMWDTAETDFNITKGPYGKDVLRMLSEACARRNVPLFLYYSVVDWHQPSYPNQNRHHELHGPEPGDQPDMLRYVEFVKAQMRELCTNYGEIAGIWWDMNPMEHYDPSVNALIRELQPKALINDRGFDKGDFGTIERILPSDRMALGSEACQSVGVQSWGYNAEEDYYSHRYLMHSIDQVLARGGRYLLNIGPKGDGSIPQEAQDSLRRIGKWYHRVAEAYDAESTPDIPDPKKYCLGQLGTTLYVHCLDGPETNGVTLKMIGAKPNKATLLNTGEALEIRIDRGADKWWTTPCLRIRGLPVNQITDEPLIIKLEFAPGSVDPELWGRYS